MDFGGSAGAQTNFDLIPAGQLAWALINLKGLKASQSGGQYLDIELTIDQGQPFAGRKIFDTVGNPYFAGNSDAYKQMGSISICRMLEAGRGAGPHNPAGYQIADFGALHGLRVAVKIKVEPGKDGYDDKNRVAEYLTPNPTSGGNKGYQMLMAGQFNTTAPKTPANGFGAPAAPAAPAPAAMFGSPQAALAAAAAPQAAQPGFQQPQGQASNTTASPAANWGNGQTGHPANPPVQNAATSPSEAAAPGAPSWLTQANGQ